MSRPLILASASPRRRQLLDQLGLSCQIVIPDVDESRLPGEPAEQYVIRLALQKAWAGWALTEGPAANNERLVIGADTCIALDDEILGKPRDQQDAQAMLSRLSGRSHFVCSAVAIPDTIEYTLLNEVAPQPQDLFEFSANSALSGAVALSQSKVTFRALTEAEIGAYWQTGEPVDKAGAYAIQGQAAAFVERLEGSCSGVMGLPLFETAMLLQRHAVTVPGV